MKKSKVILSLLSTLVLTTPLSVASANPSTGTTDLNHYNVSSSDIEKDLIASLMNGNGYIKNSQTGEIINVDVESVTTEVVNTTNTRSVSTESVNQIKAEVRASVATLPGSGIDQAMGMTVYATLFYYQTTNASGFNFVDLDKVSYRFEINDSSYDVSAKKMYISQNGLGSNDDLITTQYRNYNLDDSGDVLVRNWGWSPVLKNGLGYATGINITAVIQRGQSSSWDFFFNHPLS